MATQPRPPALPGFEPFPLSGAYFSPCRRWRYTLWRTWDKDKPTVNWLMLNPSTADENVLDPTITRCVGYSKAWGYGGLVVTNLFAWRSTDPKGLLTVPDPVGKDNDQHIGAIAESTALTIAAWGVHGTLKDRARDVLYQLTEEHVPLYCLRVTKDGHPCHPLYLPADLKPMPYVSPWSFEE